MEDKDIQRLMELAEDLRQEVETWTKEEAIASFVRAGIMDENGNLTPPYQELLALDQE
ncbi:MAG TPA: hypothetical protein VHW43_00870 [Puia sp.]|jgi:hypothetical protein|nr:hypothetical protein [Puia sp.]